MTWFKDDKIIWIYSGFKLNIVNEACKPKQLVLREAITEVCSHLTKSNHQATWKKLVIPSCFPWLLFCEQCANDALNPESWSHLGVESIENRQYLYLSKCLGIKAQWCSFQSPVKNVGYFK